MSKYICNRGAFRCKYCGTVYLYSDLRDICEGHPWHIAKNELDQNHILDHLNLNIGDPVLCTMYYGNAYAREPRKTGIHLVWFWSFVRDKRIVPGCNIRWSGVKYRHSAEYKIGKVLRCKEALDILGDIWDLKEGYCNYSTIGPFGPRHIWTLDLVREAHPEAEENTWMQFVFNYCVGPRTKNVLKHLIAEGYDISESILDDLPDELSKQKPEKRNV